MRIPVLIVGAGPTGLTLAATLKQHDVDVRIIDKRPGAVHHDRVGSSRVPTVLVRILLFGGIRSWQIGFPMLPVSSCTSQISGEYG